MRIGRMEQAQGQGWFDNWMELFTTAVQAAFGPRIVFLGLQGSRARGEAGDASDIDVVVILDELAPADLTAYRAAVRDLPRRELLCGFVSGREELACWEASELFQFYYDTVPFLGTLDFLLPRIREGDIRRAVRTGACSLYHLCCHNALHARDPEALRALRKPLFFILQAKYFLETGAYVRRRSELLPLLREEDRGILEGMGSSAGKEELDGLSGALLTWLSGVIRSFA